MGYSHRLIKDRIHSEKYLIKQYHPCVNIIGCIYTILGGIAYYTPRLHGIAYCSQATSQLLKKTI